MKKEPPCRDSALPGTLGKNELTHSAVSQKSVTDGRKAKLRRTFQEPHLPLQVQGCLRREVCSQRWQKFPDALRRRKPTSNVSFSLEQMFAASVSEKLLEFWVLSYSKQPLGPGVN